MMNRRSELRAVYEALDVGDRDARYVLEQGFIDAGASRDGSEWFDWHLPAKSARACMDVRPYVVINVDLSHLAAQLEKAFSAARA